IPLLGDDGDMVLPFLEWAALAGISERTARDLRARGKGPRCVMLTDKKLGVSLAEYRRCYVHAASRRQKFLGKSMTSPLLPVPRICSTASSLAPSAAILSSRWSSYAATPSA